MEDKHQSSVEDVLPREEWQANTPSNGKPAFGIKLVLWVLLVIFVFGMIMIPVVIREGKKMDMTQAMNNSRSIYGVMMDFESDFGRLPDDNSAAKNPELNDFRGNHSDDYLGQLIAGGYVRSEEIFFVKDVRYRNLKPDDVISPPSRIFENNECGFSYVMTEVNGKRFGLSTDDDGRLPILMAPLVNEWGSFEHKSYSGRGVYLRVDGSASNEKLDPSDHKIYVNGVTLLDSGRHTMWGNMKPVALLPEREPTNP